MCCVVIAYQDLSLDGFPASNLPSFKRAGTNALIMLSKTIPVKINYPPAIFTRAII